MAKSADNFDSLNLIPRRNKMTNGVAADNSYQNLMIHKDVLNDSNTLSNSIYDYLNIINSQFLLYMFMSHVTFKYQYLTASSEFGS